MPSEEKHKINVWIPGSLWKQIESLGYDSPTKATIAAFEALVLQEEKGSNQEALGSSQEEFRKLQEAIRKHEEITIPNLEKQVKDLEARPDPVTFAKLQARYEGLQMIIEEKDRRIEALNNDLMKAGQREEDLKQMHNNYMLQVQSLINQRAISAPSGSRTTKEATRKKQEENRKFQEASRYIEKEERLFDVDLEESPAIKEKPDIKPENKPVVNQEKNTKEVTCLNCGKVFTAARSTRLYCSGACKEAYRRKKSKEEII